MHTVPRPNCSVTCCKSNALQFKMKFSYVCNYLSHCAPNSEIEALDARVTRECENDARRLLKSLAEGLLGIAKGETTKVRCLQSCALARLQGMLPGAQASHQGQPTTAPREGGR